MANVIRLKRASGSDPAASDLVSGEPAVRTDTGELFFKKDDGSVAKVSGAGGGPDFKYLALRNAANNGAASYPNADFTLVTSGTTTAITPVAANTLLVSVNGVIQKPNTGTSTPSEGFALSGSTIKFGANISAAPDFILYQESGGIGEPSDETVSEAKLKVSNNPVNGYFLSAQSGNTGGLTWAAPVATSCTGNSATATALATARAINGVNFDGTAAITVTAAAGTLSGTTLNSSVVTSSLTSLGDLGGLTVDGDATFTGANYNVLWDKSANALEFADSAKAVFGTGSDFSIYHDGTNSIQFFDAQVGAVRFRTDIGNSTRTNINLGAGVDLYYSNSKKFETRSGGLGVFGHIEAGDNNKLMLGDANDLQIYHSGAASIVANHGTGALYLQDDGNVIIGKVTNAEVGIQVIGDGAVELYYDNVKQIETLSNGVRLKNGHLHLNESDNMKAIFGASDDLQIYHNGSHSVISNDTGTLFSLADNVSFKNNANSETIANFYANSSVELYHNNNKYFETATNGGIFRGTTWTAVDNCKIAFGSSDDLKIVHDGTNSSINNTTNDLRIESDRIELNNQASNEFYLTCTANGAVELYHNNSNKFETNAEGVRVNGYLEMLDDQRIQMGLTDDLQIYHEAGFHSYIRETQNGNLVLWTNPSGTYSTIVLGAGQENSIICNKLGSVELYHISGVGSTSKKLETRSDGVFIYGLPKFGSYAQAGESSTATNNFHFGAEGDGTYRIYAKNYGAGDLLKVIQYNGESQHFYTSGVNTKEIYHWSNNTTGMSFRSANTQRGNIYFFDSGVQFNTSSDYRLKENITSISDGITRIKQLIPRKFNWIIDESNTPVDGFLAHEVSSIVPEAINGTKDAVATQEDVDSHLAEKIGDPIHQMIDHSKLVPLLTAALQEAIGRIEALEAK